MNVSDTNSQELLCKTEVNKKFHCKGILSTQTTVIQNQGVTRRGNFIEIFFIKYHLLIPEGMFWCLSVWIIVNVEQCFRPGVGEQLSE